MVIQAEGAADESSPEAKKPDCSGNETTEACQRLDTGIVFEGLTCSPAQLPNSAKGPT